MNDHHISYQELFDNKWVSKLLFFADFCEHLNELNVKLQGSGKALDEVLKKDIGDERFRYFSKLKRHSNDLQNDDRIDCQSLQKLFLNIIKSLGEQFFTRFLKFRELEETANFMRFPDSIKMEELNLQKFSWLDMEVS